jgi:hypothetical protein
MDLLPLVKEKAKENWQFMWNANDMERMTFSIISTVSFESFFKNLHWDRRETQILSRILSNHTRLRHLLGRINIVGDMLCTCGQDYESVDHRLWYCQSYVIARVALFVALSKFNIFSTVPVRDLLAFKMFSS